MEIPDYTAKLNPEQKQPLASKIIIWSAVVGIALLSIIHVILTRPLREYGTIAMWILGSVIALTLAALAIIYKMTHRKKGWGVNHRMNDEKFAVMFYEYMVKVVIAFFLKITASTVLLYFISSSVLDLLKWLVSPSLPHKEAVPIIILTTLFIGIILFVFRLYLRSLYGITEVLIGLLVAGNRLLSESESAIADPKFYLTLLTAGVYLVVRGLDNVHQGFMKPDPFALKIFNFIEKAKKLNKSINP